MKKLIVIALLFSYLLASSQNTLNLVPMPAEVKIGKGVFSINKNTLIVIEGKGQDKNTLVLNEYLKNTVGYKLQIAKKIPQVML